MDFLRIGTALALLWAVAGLAVSWFGIRKFGARTYHSAPAGSAARGVLYAFGAGMMPWAKESVRTHLPSWAVGVGFHLGVFAALPVLAASLLGLHLPSATRVALGALALAGAACGLGLLAKRAASTALRSFSVPDDFLSNLLASAFACFAGLRALSVLPAAPLGVAAMALLVYLPFGKIRHCVFFFPTRYFFGAHFGRRGVLPTAGEGPRA